MSVAQMPTQRKACTDRKTLRQSFKRLLSRKKPPHAYDIRQPISSDLIAKPSKLVQAFSTDSLFPTFSTSVLSINGSRICIPRDFLGSSSLKQDFRHPPGPLLCSDSVWDQYGFLQSHIRQSSTAQQARVRTVPEKHAKTVGVAAEVITDIPSRQNLQAWPNRIQEQAVDIHSAGQLSLDDQRTSIIAERTNLCPRNLEEFFRCFCILDTSSPGSPVIATSTELRPVFRLGEVFFLNNEKCQETSINIVSGSDTAGNQVMRLVLFNRLLAPGSGRSRHTLVSLVDVRSLVNKTTVQKDLITPSETNSSSEDELLTPVSWHTQRGKKLDYHLSAETLLSGCFLPGENVDEQDVLLKWIQDDIWLKIATEERVRQTSAARHSFNRPTPLKFHAPSTENSIEEDLAIDNVIADLISFLKELYSDFFLLGKSPLHSDVYEICNISPTIYASRDDVHGHLSQTPQRDLDKLTLSLTHEQPFNITIKWGIDGEDKQLFCSPLFGQDSITWICFLVRQNLNQAW